MASNTTSVNSTTNVTDLGGGFSLYSSSGANGGNPRAVYTYTTPSGENLGQGAVLDAINGDDESSSGSGGGGGYIPPTPKDWAAAIAEATAAGTPSATNPNASTTTKAAVDAAKEAVDIDANIDHINRINTDYQKNLINQLTEAQKQQANNTIDYGTNTAISKLQRAETDAAETYNTQLNEIAADERRALDNQVLYNRARGDNGGIGLSQYNNIQNTAAINRLTVKNAQTKLSTDTARQIADLRAQGEYERADKLLEITQNYLSQLLDLEQYEQTTNLGVDEFNTEIDKWLNEYRLNVQQFLQNTELNYANATGAFADGTLTQSAFTSQQNQLAAIAQALISAGVAPTETQLQALGLNNPQGAAWLSRLYPYG